MVFPLVPQVIIFVAAAKLKSATLKSMTTTIKNTANKKNLIGVIYFGSLLTLSA
jgi:hypothetical protein